MSLTHIKSEIDNKKIKVLFTDYYDTIVHRKVHPNYVLRIWAKFIITELGLSISIDNLYFVRQESLAYLTKKLKINPLEVPYIVLKQEVCARLINNNCLHINQRDIFIDLFEKADLKSESNVQYINHEILSLLKDFKLSGGKIYLVSDFYASKTLFKQILRCHDILGLFDDIFSSAAVKACKHNGSIYKTVLNELSLTPSNVMMLGDNKKSDFDNAKKNGINAFLLPHKKYLIKNKRNAFGNDSRYLKHTIDNIYKNSKKRSSIPYTEYCVFYYIFVEKLYKKCKKENIKNLFFLAREGLYLKKLFDSYQEHTYLDKESKINTHYLKISRQSSLQMSLKNIKEESFDYLRKQYPSLSIYDFLINLNCPENIIKNISDQFEKNLKVTIVDFFNSEDFKELKSNAKFLEFYKYHSNENRIAFNKYIDSFNVNFKEEGINLVDIGWGGTMQESIYDFLKKRTPVTGYYLGLKEIYNIQESTKRFGLLFSIYPYSTYKDNILMANTQYYEQFSAANHGSAVGYSCKNKEYVIEYHEPNEKWLYDNYIKVHQDKMFFYHKTLLKDLGNICYSTNDIDDIITNFGLKVGLYQNLRKLKFIETLNKGFYQNIGKNQVGISYTPPKDKNYAKLLFNFLITPERYFRYLVKLQPLIYKKNKLVAVLFPSTLLYIYFKINRFLRFKVLNNKLLIKYNLLR